MVAQVTMELIRVIVVCGVMLIDQDSTNVALHWSS